MTDNAHPAHTPPSYAGRFGAARRDVTPPIGIFARNWGAAAHDTASGVHRPLTATALAILPRDGDAPLLLISLDWCHMGHHGDRDMLRAPLLELVGDDEARCIIACTHTHGVGMISSWRTDQPGGDKIPAYLRHVRDALHAAAREAIDIAQHTPGTLTFTTGRCALAANRDLPDPDPTQQRDLVGFNPDEAADDTLLVGRVTRDSDDAPLATLVNYACHPTTLAWENMRLSPDYVGAMREMVEQETRHAPCLFLQGASGELAPAHQYVGDPAIADQHGRTVGHAVLSALTQMPAPRQRLRYQYAKESGAPLAVWRPEPFAPSQASRAARLDVRLPLKSLPTLEQIDAELARCDDRAQAERLRRKRGVVEKVGSGETCDMPAWLWRLGDVLLVAHPDEAYSDLQRELRAAFPDAALCVMNVANGAAGYLYPAPLAERNIYPVWQSPFAPDGLATLIDTLRAGITDQLGVAGTGVQA